jgi:hypothetical protein
MSPRQSSWLLHTSLVGALYTVGCSTLPETADIPSARNAQAAVTIGKSTKADVEAALGKTLVVGFDSGYEVWIYRERSASVGSGLFGRPAKERPELVLLFEPAGILKKTRIRMPE